MSKLSKGSSLDVMLGTTKPFSSIRVCVCVCARACVCVCVRVCVCACARARAHVCHTCKSVLCLRYVHADSWECKAGIDHLIHGNVCALGTRLHHHRPPRPRKGNSALPRTRRRRCSLADGRIQFACEKAFAKGPCGIDDAPTHHAIMQPCPPRLRCRCRLPALRCRRLESLDWNLMPTRSLAAEQNSCSLEIPV